MPARIGIVVIGRNEGARLVASLESVFSSVRQSGATAVVVYVDSGSSDDSVMHAKRLGAEIAVLDSSLPFSAARARNLGMERVSQRLPGMEFLQFIDGDCRIAPEWMPAATKFMEGHPDYAVACGRRREIAPEASVFNALCDAEWDTPLGDATECGGDFFARAEALQAAAGFNPDLIAGEEPELCFRLRNSGWRIMRLDEPMTFHDAAISRWSQWWKRSVRSGFAYAARGWLHRSSGSGYMLHENVRISAWAWGLPALSAFGALLGSRLWWALLAAYPLQALRLSRILPKHNPHLSRLNHAVFLVLGKWPEAVGQLNFLAEVLSGRRKKLIEYK